MIASIDYPVGKLIVVDNGQDPEVRGVLAQIEEEGRFDLHVHRPGFNLGVSASWNWIIHDYPQADYWLLVGNDIEFLPGDLVKIDTFVRAHPDYVLMPCNHGHSLFAMTPLGRDTVGMFDENLYPAYCIDPSTPILTADLRWIPIGDVQIGQRLVGVEEFAAFRRGVRRYKPTEVTGRIIRSKQPSLRLIFEDGREVICSSDHRWLGRSARRVEIQHWIHANDLKPGFRIVSPLNVWRTETSFSGGWVSGMFDGEGSLHMSSGGSKTRALTLSQKPGPVMDRVAKVLTDLGIPFCGPTTRTDNGVSCLDINTRKFAMEFLGRFRPVRLLQERFWDGACLRSKNVEQFATIEAIEKIGDRDLVDISTTTHTFLANGMVSHNCEDSDQMRRIALAGAPWQDVPNIHALHGEAPTYGSHTIYADPVMFAKNQITHKNNFLYYQRKWGGPPGEERFVHPYDDEGLTLKDWIADESLAVANENINICRRFGRAIDETGKPL